VPLNDGPSPNGSTYAGTNRHTLSILHAQPGDAGAYVCVAQTSCPLSGRTSVSLSVGTCTPDFNQDGTLSVQDLFDFLATWFAGTAEADYNGDGNVGIGDIFSYIGGWFGGC